MKAAAPLLLLLAPAVPLFSQAPAPSDAPDRRTISVQGEAEVKVVPDEVILTLGVETNDLSLQAAKEENDRRISEVIDVLKGRGLRSKDIQTDHLSIEPRYRDRYEARDFLGYWVRRNVVATLKDLDRFETVLSAVLESGANYVHGIQFQTTELRKHRDKARALAVQAAREKAADMAAVLDQKIGSPLNINESWSGWNSWYGAGWGSHRMGMMQNVVQDSSGGGGTGSPLEPGQISVTARVGITFELRDAPPER